MTPDEFWAAFEDHAPRWRAMFRQRTYGNDLDADELLNDLRWRTWRAFVRGQFAGPGQAVRYAEAALPSVAVDRWRSERRHRIIAGPTLDAPPPNTDADPSTLLAAISPSLLADEAPTAEDLAGVAAWRRQFWEILLPELNGPAERIAAGTLALAIAPREVVAHWPHLFADARAVYTARHRIIERLRRRRGLRAALQTWEEAA